MALPLKPRSQTPRPVSLARLLRRARETGRGLDPTAWNGYSPDTWHRAAAAVQALRGQVPHAVGEPDAGERAELRALLFLGLLCSQLAITARLIEELSDDWPTEGPDGTPVPDWAKDAAANLAEVHWYQVEALAEVRTVFLPPLSERAPAPPAAPPAPHEEDSHAG